MSAKTVCALMIGMKRSDDNEHKDLAIRCSLQSWIEYCKKHDAKMHVMIDKDDQFIHDHVVWNKLAFFQRHVKMHDVSLIVDLDIVVKPDAKDVFSLFPEDVDYMCLDEMRHMGCPEKRRVHEKQIRLCERLGFDLEKWKQIGDYKLHFNAGVMLVRSCVGDLFSDKDWCVHDAKKIFREYFEQTYVNAILNCSDLRYGSLPLSFNQMAHIPFSQRFDADFIHHAGPGWKGQNGVNKYTQIVDDFVSLFGCQPKSIDELLSECEIMQNISVGKKLPENANIKRPSSIMPKEMLDEGIKYLKGCFGLSGSIAECGVYTGGSACAIAEASFYTGKKLHLFDSFAGLPKPDPSKGDTHKEGGFVAKGTSFDEVSSVMSLFPNVTIHKGFIPSTFSEVDESERFCFVHLDVDLYWSVYDSLKFFWPRMVSSGLILLQDHCSPTCKGATRAAEDFMGKDNICTDKQGWGIVRKS